MLLPGAHPTLGAATAARPRDRRARPRYVRVGEGRTPPVYLQAGDVSVCSIERIGTLTNPVVAAPAGR